MNARARNALNQYRQSRFYWRVTSPIATFLIISLFYANSFAYLTTGDNEVKRVTGTDVSWTGRWNYLVDEKTRTTVARTIIEGHEEIAVQYFDDDYVTELEFRSEGLRNGLFLWKIRVRPYAVFFADEPTGMKALGACTMTDANGTAPALKATAEEVERSLKEGCTLTDIEKAHSAIESVLAENSKTPMYFECVANLAAKYSKSASWVRGRQQQLAMAGKEQTIRCEKEVASKKSARFDEKFETVVLKTAVFQGAATDKDREKLFFHELLHSSGMVEADVKDVEECCQQPLDPKSPKCKNLLPNDVSPAPRTPGVVTGPSNPQNRIPKPTILSAKGRDVSRSKAEDSEVTQVEKLKSSRPSFLDLADKDPTFAKRVFDEAKHMKVVAEPARQLARLQILPRAEAAVERVKNDNHTVPIIDDDEKKAKAARASERPTGEEKTRLIAKPAPVINNDEREPNAARAPQRPERGEETRPSANPATVTVTESGSITPSSVETRIVGFDKKTGAPKLQLRNGQMITSFTAFSGLSANSNFIPVSSASTAPSNTGSSQANILVGAGRPQPSRSGQSSGTATLAGSTDNGGSGGSGGDSGFGTVGPRATDTRNVRSPSNVRGSDEPVVSSVDLKPRSQSIESLRSVPVQTSGDAMRIIKAADAPRELLKQQWFVERLRSDALRIQIYDGKNPPIGSQNPRIRWNLPYLLRDQSP